MYKRISGVKFWLLGCVTFGIYPLVVWNNMGKNLNAMAEKVGEAPIRSYVSAFFLGFVTFGIYPIVWLFKFFGLASRLNEKANAGITPTGKFVMFLMGCIPIYSFFWLANMNNKLADVYEQQFNQGEQYNQY